MAHLLRCDNCDKRIELDDEDAGRSIRCPRCKELVPVRDNRRRDEDDDEYDVVDDEDRHEGRRKNRRGSGRKRASNVTAIWFVVGAGVIALAAIAVGIVAYAVKRNPAGPNGLGPPPVGPSAVVSDLTAAQTIQPGILFQEAVLRPGSVPMRVWYYRPDRVTGKLPLVLVPPAGSTLFAGMELGDGDRDEHYPYVRAGFAVASFEIDGHVPDAQGASDAAVLKGAREFRDARAELNNAKAALDYLLAKSGDLDPNRIYIAGHSSAATLAVLVAEHEPRIKGCLAYCGVYDVEERLAPVISRLDRALPGYRDFLRSSSPKTHVDKLTCPTFLFHARDDSNVPPSQTTNFAALLRKTNRDVTADTSATGDHYDSMIQTGIPRGIAWLQTH
jgi:dienelactone hydrolase